MAVAGRRCSVARYRKRDPEFLACQFDGSNIGEVLDSLGGAFSTRYPRDAKGYSSFVLSVVRDKYREDFSVYKGQWVVFDPVLGSVAVLPDGEFRARYEAVKRPGRPPAKEKK